ncbi:MAG: hypothetical protein Q9162_007656, partial [Coniocarpon cinnabarinum]
MDYTDGERKDHAMENAPESPTTEMSLRDHLLAASQASQQASQSPPNTQQPHQAPATSQPQQSTSTEGTSSPSPINHVSSSRAANSTESHLGSGGETASDKAKRELSSSKRAAQNRAAQRAFRQRKESYIKKLEDDVRNASALPALQENLQRVQQENFHMRDYIMALQSRLLDLTGEFPPPPSTLELRDPRSGAPIS